MAVGRLVLVGGREDRGPGVALRAAAADGPVVVVTTATSIRHEVGPEYARLFRALGADDVRLLHPRSRAEAADPRLLERVADAEALFFVGGDQRRLTVLADTPLARLLHARWRAGATVAGTSAGAMALASIALCGGPGADHQEPNPLALVPGLGLLRDAVVDTHFSQRGRLPRLLAAVARNPHALGIGIDEDTAALVEGDELRVVGRGHVYVVDGRSIDHTAHSGTRPLGIESAHGATLHILGPADRFNLATRRPCLPEESTRPTS
jgi:cyanophycinase